MKYIIGIKYVTICNLYKKVLNIRIRYYFYRQDNNCIFYVFEFIILFCKKKQKFCVLFFNGSTCEQYFSYFFFLHSGYVH